MFGGGQTNLNNKNPRVDGPQLWQMDSKQEFKAKVQDARNFRIDRLHSYDASLNKFSFFETRRKGPVKVL